MDDQLSLDGLIQSRQRKESLVTQGRKNPSIRNLNGILDGCFVAGSVGTSGHDSHLIVVGKVGKSLIEYRLIAIGFDPSRLQIVWNNPLRTATKVQQGILTNAQDIFQLSGSNCF